ncbi:CoA-transferase family III domain-containing protein [Suillus clintonianus]|uniref:CoA-transferase family III domain-containing protein n=1 Tax=Suillus clintonianus TaxID=1904413 RepID=UPI001B86F6FF|nr:CoA-transferase family III domain-containing protein [Suillus clintonianus]KAG2131810.1 CoA-transferase family III domain-containing protein [Suillus clintonianus]
MPTASVWDRLAGIYRTKDDSFVRLHLGRSFVANDHRSHPEGILNISQCDPTYAAKQKTCVSAHRSFKEWDKHPHAPALRGTLLIQLIKIGSAPKRVLGNWWPVCGRTLAVYGADVFLITSSKLPKLPILDIDTSRGKRTTQLDLTEATQRDCLKELVKDANVFLQAYRQGGLQEKGFGPRELAKVRHDCYGLNWVEAEALTKFNGQPVADKPEPRALAMQALDHVVGGYFLAFGIQAVITKTIIAVTGKVRVYLAAVAQWLRSLGQLPLNVAFGDGKPLTKRTILRDPEVAVLSVTLREATVCVTPVKDAVEAPVCFDRHQPAWLPRV